MSWSGDRCNATNKGHFFAGVQGLRQHMVQKHPQYVIHDLPEMPDAWMVWFPKDFRSVKPYEYLEYCSGKRRLSHRIFPEPPKARLPAARAFPEGMATSDLYTMASQRKSVACIHVFINGSDIRTRQTASARRALCGFSI